MLPALGAAAPESVAGTVSDAGAADAAAVHASLQKLTAERNALVSNQVSATEQAQMRERYESVALFRERAATLEAGTKALAEGITASTSKVVLPKPQIVISELP